MSGEVRFLLAAVRRFLGSQVALFKKRRLRMRSKSSYSGFEEAAICTVDDPGDFVSASMAFGSGGRFKTLERIYPSFTGNPLHGHHTIPGFSWLRRRIQRLVAGCV